MTSPGEDPGPVPDEFSVVAEFVDGESVGMSRLKEALSSPQARDYLVDLLALRASVRATGYADLGGPHKPGQVVRTSRWVAAGLILAALGGYLLGQHRAQPTAATDASLSPIVIDLNQPRSAPTPTQIIRLEPGWNWETRRGGN